MPAPIDRRRIAQLAWPIILANLTTPLLGLTDTAVIGHVGSTAALGALALGSLIINFLYWGFGFLRMGTVGHCARAAGRGDEAEVRAGLARALLLGLAIGGALWLLQRPLAWLLLPLFTAGPDIQALTAEYLHTRLWGAPAALATYGLLGLLIGLGENRRLLAAQLVINGLNIGLDLWLAGVLDLGVRGVALGTALAEWGGLAFTGALVWRLLRRRHRDDAPFWPGQQLRDRNALRHTLRTNTDLLLRTLCLLAGFAWFTREGARLGDLTLAGNHLLLQLISLSAFFLDGFAHAAEGLVGRAIGARRRADLDAAVRHATELAALTAAVLATLIVLAGPLALAGLTDLTEVHAQATNHLPYTAAYVLLSFAAFQLDGIFIAAGATRALRNAALVALLLFLALAGWLVDTHANPGLWLAFIAYVIARAIALGAHYPALRRNLGAPPEAGPTRGPGPPRRQAR